MRILVVAYACEPNRGSEPAVGWSISREIAREHEVVVLTRAANRAAIEAEEPRSNPSYLYYDTPRALRFYKRGAQGVHLYYLLWQAGALRVALEEHRRRPFDLVHHLTFSAAWMPALAAFFPAPLLWGPVASNTPVPEPLAAKLLDAGERIENHARAALDAGTRWNALVTAGRRRAVRVLAVNREVAARLAPAPAERRLVVPAVGAEDPPSPGAEPFEAANARGTATLDGALRPPDAPGGLDLIQVGRLIGLKGYVLTLEAFARALGSGRLGSARLTIVGDGPRRRDLERLAAGLGVAGRVTFTGALEKAETEARIARADMMLFPAFDAGGMVVIEAMARGVPVIALRTGGPAESVDATSGVLVEPTTFDATASALARAIVELASNPALRAELGAGARRRFLARYTWAERGREIRDILAAIGRSTRR